VRFILLIWFELPYYAWRRGSYALSLTTAVAVLWFLGCTTVLCRLNLPGALWVLVVPTFVNSALLMYGNWCQHIFVDPARPRSNYALAYNVINHPCNQRSFNDGYHIEHHVNSRRHWSELPWAYGLSLHKYKEEKAVVFEGLDFFQVGYLVFAQRYDVLQRHFVNHAEVKDVEAFLRARLAPITVQ